MAVGIPVGAAVVVVGTFVVEVGPSVNDTVGAAVGPDVVVVGTPVGPAVVVVGT